MIKKLQHSNRVQLLKKILLISIYVVFGLYCFYIPSFSYRYPLNYIGYPLVFILFILVILYVVLFEKIRIDIRHLLFPCFVLFALLSTILGSKSIREWITLLLLSVTYFITILLYDISPNKKVILNILYLSLLLFAFYFLVVYFKDLLNFKNIKFLRLGEKFANVNIVAGYFVSGAAIGFYYILFFRTKTRFIHILPFSLFLVLGVATGSRSFFLSAIFILLFLLFFKFKKKKILFLGIVLSIIVTLIVLINLPFMNTMKNRFLDMFSTLYGGDKIEGSTVERTVWQKFAFYLGLKNLFIGHGMGGFAVFSGVGVFSHSNLFEVFCNFGITGFFLYHSIWFLSFLYYSKSKNSDKVLALVLLSTYLLRSLFNVYYYNKISSVELSLFLCMCFDRNYSFFFIPSPRRDAILKEIITIEV